MIDTSNDGNVLRFSVALGAVAAPTPTANPTPATTV